MISILLVNGQSVQSKYNGLEIKIGDNWIKQDSGIPPINTDTVLFNETIISKIEYPFQALRMGIEGDVVCTIELNELGEVIEYLTIKDIGAGTSDVIANVLKSLPPKWAPARVNEKSVSSRIWILFNFHLGTLNSYTEKDAYHSTYLIMATGGGKWKTVNARKMEIKSKGRKKKT